MSARPNTCWLTTLSYLLNDNLNNITFSFEPRLCGAYFSGKIRVLEIPNNRSMPNCSFSTRVLDAYGVAWLHHRPFDIGVAAGLLCVTMINAQYQQLVSRTFPTVVPETQHDNDPLRSDAVFMIRCRGDQIPGDR